MIIKNDEEMVCAYLDNQFSGADKSAFEQRLKEESELQALVKRFRQADQAYEKACNEPLQSPIPDKVLSLLKAAQPDKPGLFRAWPIAATVAAVAITTSLVTTQFNNDDIELVMFNVLEQEPSANLIWLDEKHTSSMLVKLSFQHKNGQYCRDYVVEKQGVASRQIACKDQQWKIMLQAPSTTLNKNEAYLPAGEQQNAEIEDYINLSIQGDGLDLKQEQALIKQKWQ